MDKCKALHYFSIFGGGFSFPASVIDMICHNIIVIKLCVMS